MRFNDYRDLILGARYVVNVASFIEQKNHELLIEAYQRHYRQSNITGEIDRETIILIKQHYKDMLT